MTQPTTWQTLVNRVHDGEATPGEHADYERAVAERPERAMDRALLDVTRDAVRHGPPVAVPSTLRSGILDRLHEEPAPVRRLPSAWAGTLRRSAALAAAVLVMAGIFHVASLPDQLQADVDTTETLEVEFTPSQALRDQQSERRAHDEPQPALLEAWLRLTGGEADEGS